VPVPARSGDRVEHLSRAGTGDDLQVPFVQLLPLSPAWSGSATSRPVREGWRPDLEKDLDSEDRDASSPVLACDVGRTDTSTSGRGGGGDPSDGEGPLDTCEHY